MISNKNTFKSWWDSFNCTYMFKSCKQVPQRNETLNLVTLQSLQNELNDLEHE